MNDCVRSSIANVSSFAQATAGWEVKKRRTGTVMNKSFSWKATPSTGSQWLNRVVPRAGTKEPLNGPVPVRQLCGSPTMKSAGVAYPLHYVGSSAAPRRSALSIGPSWLFMHLPSSMAAGGIRKCRSVGNATEAAAAASGVVGTSTPWHRQQQPFIMAHLAGVRTGAWSRRALMRAYGWWHVAADDLIARQLGWNRRPHGTLVLLPAGGSGLRSSEDVHEQRTLMGKTITSLARLDVLVANLLPSAASPAVALSSPSSRASFGRLDARVRHPAGWRSCGARGEQSCAWMPPKCWAAEYTTQLGTSVRGRLREPRRREPRKWEPRSGSRDGWAAQQPAAAGTQRAERRAAGGWRARRARRTRSVLEATLLRRGARHGSSAVAARAAAARTVAAKAWEVPRALAAERAWALARALALALTKRRDAKTRGGCWLMD